MNLIQMSLLGMYCLYKSAADDQQDDDEEEEEKPVTDTDAPEYIYSSEYRLEEPTDLVEEPVDETVPSAGSQSDLQIRIRQAG